MKITRNNTIIYEGEFDTALYTKNDLNQEYIDVSILSPLPIIFQKGDVFNYEGNDYFLDETSVTAVKNNSHNFSFSLKFYPSYYKALEVAFLYQNRSVFPIDANLDTLITLLVQNLNRVDSGWSKGAVPSTTILALDFSNSNCIEALAYISSVFDMQFSMENKVITLYKTPSNLPKKTLNYPKDFDRVERNIEGRQKIVNKVYATGSTENLPADYGYDTLRIDPLQDNNSISKYGLSEGFYSNTDIKPTTQARITSATSEAWVIGTTDIGYDINNYIQNNAKPIINFETGQLAGLSFYIKNSVFTSGQSIITIERSNHGGVTVPNDNLKAVSGDLFNITNIQQPLEVVQQAEQKLREEALEFLNKRKENNAQVRIDLTPFGDYIPNFDEKIIINEPQFDIYSEYFVKSITKNINHPNNYMVELTYNRRALKMLSPSLGFEAPNLDLPIYVDITSLNEKVLVVSDNLVAVEVKADSAVNGVENINNNVIPTLATNQALTAVEVTADSAVSGVNSLTPKVSTLETDIVKKASIESVIAIELTASDALNGVGALTPKVETLELDIVNKATIDSVTAVELTATTANTNANSALNGVNSLTPKVNTLETDISTKASIVSLTEVDNKVIANTTSIGTINTELPNKATIVALSETDTKASNALNGVTTLTPKVETLETEFPLVDGKATNALTLAGTADGNANSALSGVNTLTPKVSALEVDIVTKASVESVDQVVNEINTINPKVIDLENNTQHISVVNNKTVIQNELLANGVKLQSGTYKTISGADGINAKLHLNGNNSITVENGLITYIS